MRTMKVKTWKSKMPDGSEIEESIIDALTGLIMNKRPEDMPRGLDNFRLMHGITKAFDKAREKGVLKLEDTDYLFLKKAVKDDIPSIWGVNPACFAAIEEFMELKAEES